MEESVRSKWQSGEVKRVHRSRIKFLPRNTQQMDEYEEERLGSSIEKHGLVEPLIWNETTGHLVGGNHRLKEIDKKEGNLDYFLDVSAIKISEKKERSLAIILNNRKLQGTPDLARIGDDFRSGVDFEESGWAKSDIYREFGTDILEESPGKLAEFADQIKDSQEVMDREHEKTEERDDQDYFVSFVFRNRSHRDTVMGLLGFDENRFQPGEALRFIFTDGKYLQEAVAVETSDGIRQPLAKISKKAIVFLFDSEAHAEGTRLRLGLDAGPVYDGSLLDTVEPE